MKTLGSQLDPALLARTRRYEKLSHLLRQHLPTECDQHYVVTTIRQQELVIMADSPVWATRLRQLAPQILSLAKQQFSQLQQIQVSSRIATSSATSSATSGATSSATSRPVGISPAAPVQRRLSQAAGQQINSAASCIADEALKNALLKLARRSKKSAD